MQRQTESGGDVKVSEIDAVAAGFLDGFDVQGYEGGLQDEATEAAEQGLSVPAWRVSLAAMGVGNGSIDYGPTVESLAAVGVAFGVSERWVANWRCGECPVSPPATTWLRSRLGDAWKPRNRIPTWTRGRRLCNGEWPVGIVLRGVAGVARSSAVGRECGTAGLRGKWTSQGRRKRHGLKSKGRVCSRC